MLFRPYFGVSAVSAKELSIFVVEWFIIKTFFDTIGEFTPNFVIFL